MLKYKIALIEDAKADDFDAEVEALRGSRRFQHFLDKRMRSQDRIPIEDIEREVEEESTSGPK